MFGITLFLLCTTLCYAMPANKIVNGTDAGEGDFPFMVSFQLFGSHSCGGSIVSETHVLTAAHCVSGYSPSYMTIKYGSVNLNSASISTIEVIQTTVHEDYDPQNGWRNDVALLTLASPIVFSETVQPIQLPQQDEQFEGWSEVILIGWGSEYTAGEIMNHLQKVSILLFPVERCEAAHGTMFDKNTHVCAGIVEGGKGQCSGDSGGPLLINGVVVGTVSWSVKPCTIVGYPGVFARVPRYIDWIRENLLN